MSVSNSLGVNPIYEPRKWNSDRYIRLSHNCYAYAMDTIQPELGTLCRRRMRQIMRQNAAKQHPCKQYFPQPGRYAKHDVDNSVPEFHCKNVSAGMLADNPGIVKMTGQFNGSCPQGHYKIALASNSDGDDYHYWRQDKDGSWSHKNGRSRANRVDKRGRKITDPKSSARGEYTEFCGYYCVPLLKSYKSL